MIEIDVDGAMSQDLIKSVEPDKLEEIMNEVIIDGIKKKIADNLEQMSFIEIEYNEETKAFEFNASLVLCSKQNIISNAEVMSQKMKSYGLTETQVLDVLETMQDDQGGF